MKASCLHLGTCSGYLVACAVLAVAQFMSVIVAAVRDLHELGIDIATHMEINASSRSTARVSSVMSSFKIEGFDGNMSIEKHLLGSNTGTRISACRDIEAANIAAELRSFAACGACQDAKKFVHGYMRAFEILKDANHWQSNLLNISALPLAYSALFDLTSGTYRSEGIVAGDRSHQFPAAKELPSLVEGFALSLSHTLSRSDLSLYGKAAWAAYNFVNIHPFPDGNGRLSTILANVVLQRSGLPIYVAISTPRDAYIKSLKAADASSGAVHEFAQHIHDACTAAVAKVAANIQSSSCTHHDQSQPAVSLLEAAESSFVNLAKNAAADGQTSLLISGLSAAYPRMKKEYLKRFEMDEVFSHNGEFYDVCSIRPPVPRRDDEWNAEVASGSRWRKNGYSDYNWDVETSWEQKDNLIRSGFTYCSVAYWLNIIFLLSTLNDSESSRTMRQDFQKFAEKILADVNAIFGPRRGKVKLTAHPASSIKGLEAIVGSEPRGTKQISHWKMTAAYRKCGDDASATVHHKAPADAFVIHAVSVEVTHPATDTPVKEDEGWVLEDAYMRAVLKKQHQQIQSGIHPEGWLPSWFLPADIVDDMVSSAFHLKEAGMVSEDSEQVSEVADDAMGPPEMISSLTVSVPATIPESREPSRSALVKLEVFKDQLTNEITVSISSPKILFDPKQNLPSASCNALLAFDLTTDGRRSYKTRQSKIQLMLPEEFLDMLESYS